MRERKFNKQNIQNDNNDSIKDNKKRILKINIKTISVMVLLIILLILIPLGYALFSDTETDNSEVKIGTIEVRLIEDWPKIGEVIPEKPDEVYNEFGLERTYKTIYGESIAELDSYVRVKLIPIVEYYNDDNQWITIPVAQEDIVMNVEADDWVQSNNYWYYTKILKGSQNATQEDDSKTGEMAINWQITSIPSGVSEYPIRTDVRVLLEYAQTTNNMWKDLFQIEDLPAEVERVVE